MTTHAIYSNHNLTGGNAPLDPATIVLINTSEKNLYLALVDFNQHFGKLPGFNVHEWAYLDSLSMMRSAVFTNKNPYLVVAYAIFLSCNFEVEEMYHALMRLLILDNADYKIVDKVTLSLRSFIATIADAGQKKLIEDQRDRVKQAWSTGNNGLSFEPGIASKKMNEVIDEVVRTMAQNTVPVGTSPGEKITLEQLRSMIAAENKRLVDSGKPGLEYTEDEIKEIFDELDEDSVMEGGNPKDFRISKSDGQLILKALTDAKFNKKSTGNIKVSYDLKKLIDKIAEYGYTDVKTIATPELDAIFKSIDVNNTGEIEESELPKFMVELNKLMTTKNMAKIADTFADKLIEADKQMEALKKAQQSTGKEPSVDLSSSTLNKSSFIDTILALNKKSQNNILGEDTSNFDATTILQTDIGKKLEAFFDVISNNQAEISYSDYLAAIRLVDNKLLNYLGSQSSSKCADSAKVPEFKPPTSTDSLIDRIIKKKGVNVRDMNYTQYKDIMDELKLEIEAGVVPSYAGPTMQLTKVDKAQDPATAQSVADIKKALDENKIKPMINGLAIENVFKEIADGDLQITAPELVRFMAKYGVTLTPQQATTLIKQIDLEGDGTLGIVEFASLIGKQNSTNDVIEQYRQLYEGLKDGKAALSVDDLKTLLKKHNTDSNIDELVQQADLNKDAQIDFNEFLKLMIDESKDNTVTVKAGGNKKFISNRESMDNVISRNESLRDRVRLIGKYKPSNLKKK
jgi:Ca2+-binding EF-hand superfamily protein